MDQDILLDQNNLFDAYYQDGLAIRAICDDKNFPGEYSPVFVNIHIQGVEYFQKLGISTEQFERVFKLFEPETEERLQENLLQVKSETAKELLSKICIGKQLQELDMYLEETTGIENYFGTQLANQKRLYLDEDFRSHMLALYIHFVKPYIASYDDKKIQAAFHKGRIQDMIRKINGKLKKAQEEEAE